MPQDDFPIIQFEWDTKQQITIKGTKEALILLQCAIVSAIAQNKGEAELLEPSSEILTVIIEHHQRSSEKDL